MIWIMIWIMTRICECLTFCRNRRIVRNMMVLRLLATTLYIILCSPIILLRFITENFHSFSRTFGLNCFFVIIVPLYLISTFSIGIGWALSYFFIYTAAESMIDSAFYPAEINRYGFYLKWIIDLFFNLAIFYTISLSITFFLNLGLLILLPLLFFILFFLSVMETYIERLHYSS